jgi:hypothetical protein
MSAIIHFSNLSQTSTNVRFTPESGHSAARLKCPVSANKRLPSEQLSYTTHYFSQSGENPSSPFQTKRCPT